MTQIRDLWETSVIIGIIYTSFLSALIGTNEKNHEKSAFGCIATDKLEFKLDGPLATFQGKHAANSMIL